MKTTVWFIVIMLFTGFGVQSQILNKIMHDPDKDQQILIGYCTRGGFGELDFGSIFDEEYELYEADPQAVKQIGEFREQIHILLVLGTWCHDSQEQVPRFFRILDDAGYSDDDITLLALDGKKTGGDVDIEHLGIEFVPTFIIYRNGKEAGRIVETPEISLEADLLNILQ